MKALAITPSDRNVEYARKRCFCVSLWRRTFMVPTTPSEKPLDPRFVYRRTARISNVASSSSSPVESDQPHYVNLAPLTITGGRLTAMRNRRRIHLRLQRHRPLRDGRPRLPLRPRARRRVYPGWWTVGVRCIRARPRRRRARASLGRGELREGRGGASEGGEAAAAGGGGLLGWQGE